MWKEIEKYHKLDDLEFNEFVKVFQRATGIDLTETENAFNAFSDCLFELTLVENNSVPFHVMLNGGIRASQFTGIQLEWTLRTVEDKRSGDIADVGFSIKVLTAKHELQYIVEFQLNYTGKLEASDVWCAKMKKED